MIITSMAIGKPPDAATIAQWIAFFQTVIPLLMPVAIAILAFYVRLQTEISKRTQHIAQQAATTADVTAVRLDAAMERNEQQNVGLLDIAEKTHTLVNSQHGVALASNLQLAIKVAELTTDPAKKLEADAAVEIARQKLDDHEAKQKRVDESQKTNDSQQSGFLKTVPVKIVAVSESVAQSVASTIAKQEEHSKDSGDSQTEK